MRLRKKAGAEGATREEEHELGNENGSSGRSGRSDPKIFSRHRRCLSCCSPNPVGGTSGSRDREAPQPFGRPRILRPLGLRTTWPRSDSCTRNRAARPLRFCLRTLCNPLRIPVSSSSSGLAKLQRACRCLRLIPGYERLTTTSRRIACCRSCRPWSMSSSLCIGQGL